MNTQYLRKHFDYKNGRLIRTTNLHRVGRVGREIGYLHTNGYIRAVVQQEYYYLHRLIWQYHNGSIPKGMEIDHINHDRSDNRIENLRLVSQMENKQNFSLSGRSTTGEANIRYRSDMKKYQVRFMVQSTNYDFGWFPTLEEAILIRDKAKVELGFHPNHGS